MEKIRLVTKCLKTRGIGKHSVLGEQFHVVPGFPNGDLKVSENWVQIKGTYIPKNFIE